MPRWLVQLMGRIRELAARGHVRFTLKAIRELAALGLGLDVQDFCDVLVRLTTADFVKRIQSDVTGEWMYVFKPAVAGTVVYLKVVVRSACVVVSFHEDQRESA